MARETTPQHAPGQGSRQLILDAALRIAGERGYVGTTMAQVSKASGLPGSSVYQHFRNKDELLAEAVDHGYRRFDREAPRWREADPSQPLEEEVLAQLRATTGTLDEPGFWRMGLLLALETGPSVGSAPRERFLDVRTEALARLTDWWARTLGTITDPEGHARTLALLTVASADGLFLAHESDTRDLTPAVEALARGLAAVARLLAAGEVRSRRDTRRLPPARPDAAVPESARGRLLHAAAAVAAERGYAGATISRICERAGVPASSVYRSFKDKDDLLGAAIEQSYQEWYAAQPAWSPLDPGARWQDQLHDHFTVSLRSLAERPLFLRIGHQLLLLRRDDPPAARARFVAVRRQAHLVLVQWYAQALGADPTAAPESMAQLTMALSDGLFFSNQLDEPTWDVELFAELLVLVLDAAAITHPRR